MNPLFFAFVGSFIGSSLSNYMTDYLSNREERKRAKDVIRRAEALLDYYHEFYDDSKNI